MKQSKKSSKKAKAKAKKKTLASKKPSSKSVAKGRKSVSPKRRLKDKQFEAQLIAVLVSINVRLQAAYETMQTLEVRLADCCKEMDRAGTFHLLTKTVRNMAYANGWVKEPEPTDKAPG